MIPELRRNKILEILKESEILPINDIVAKLNVSRVTIQRDVNYLEKKNLLEKVHGGVKLIKDIDSNVELRFNYRLSQNYDKKLEIAKKAINYVKEDSTIFTDSSSTVYVFAKELFKRKFKDLNIITMSPAIVCGAMKYRGLRVICTGGLLREDFNMFEGKVAIDFLEKINIDAAFISAAGVSIEDGITTGTMELFEILKVVFDRSMEVNLLVDSSKFLKKGMLKINELKNCKRIITNKDIDKEILSGFNNLDEVELILT